MPGDERGISDLRVGAQANLLFAALAGRRAHAVAGHDRIADELDLPRARRLERERACGRSDIEALERRGQSDAFGDLFEAERVDAVGKAADRDFGRAGLGQRDRRKVIDQQAVFVGRVVELEDHAVAAEARFEIDPRPFVAESGGAERQRRGQRSRLDPAADMDGEGLHVARHRAVGGVDRHGLGEAGGRAEHGHSKGRQGEAYCRACHRCR